MTQNIEQKKDGEVKKESSAAKFVTSTKTIDFPSLNWGIQAGEKRELPVEASSQEIILSNHYITLIK